MSCCLAGTIMGFDISWIGLWWGLSVWLLGSLILIMLIVFVLVKLPATYYQDGHAATFSSSGYHPGVRWLIWIVRNILGLLLIVVGVLLSLPGIPGQGLLTIMIGLLVLELPGKRRLERKLIGRPQVLRAINRLRNRFGKPPLILENKPEKPDEHDDPGAVRTGTPSCRQY